MQQPLRQAQDKLPRQARDRAFDASVLLIIAPKQRRWFDRLSAADPGVRLLEILSIKRVREKVG